jgi:CelD/BcsL family acetyltransferase involved in cellulose biosynthesis
MLHHYRTDSCLPGELNELEQQWLDLQARAECSFFQSWGWMGHWLTDFGAALTPVVIRVWLDEQLVGLGVFLPRQIRRRALFHASAMFLNEYPFDGKNMVIEYNGLLAARGHEQAVYAETVSFLLEQHPGVDEFHFGAMADQPDLVNLQQAIAPSCRLLVEDMSTAWQVNLGTLNPGLQAFIDTLSKKRRNQLRRSLRHYEESGPVSLVEAADREQALAFFAGLEELHTRRRQLKGEGGAFANPGWEKFHRQLILERFDAGEIQLLRVSNAHMTIGYLYNLIWRKQVYVMQTGFSMTDDRRDQPGYVVHALAIAHNRDRGMSGYDLMHGDSLYKQILCGENRKLVWAVVQRPLMKFRVENAVVALVRHVRGLVN